MTALTVTREPWMVDAACRGLDPELFYPRLGEPTDRARAICNRCPVKQACLALAMRANERDGIWGGLSGRQRRALRRDRTRTTK
jgi:WhiB family redox-sensing transcriptional regulator